MRNLVRHASRTMFVAGLAMLNLGAQCGAPPPAIFVCDVTSLSGGLLSPATDLTGSWFVDDAYIYEDCDDGTLFDNDDCVFCTDTCDCVGDENPCFGYCVGQGTGLPFEHCLVRKNDSCPQGESCAAISCCGDGISQPIRFEIETENENFSGVIILHFNQGGLRGIEKLKKVA